MESQTTSSAQVIVVGAGVSGLQAAYRIQQSGASCLVLEATNRIGGQAFFNSSFNPVNHPRTYGLAKRLQLVSKHQNRQENLVGDVVSQVRNLRNLCLF
jgi:monoamine oxidase